MKNPVRWLVPLAFAAATLAGAASAQAFPGGRPITLVVPFPAGEETDRIARDLAPALGRALGGAEVVVDNLAGAGGAMGTNKVAKAPADGYTLLVNHIAMATMPALLPKLPFDVERDFEPLGLISEVPMTLVGKPSLPAGDMKELAAWMRRNKGRINLAHAGVGSPSHLCGLVLQQAVGIEMTAVPYKGSGPAMTDLVGGQVDLMCGQATSTRGHIAAKKVRAYAVTTSKRVPMPALQDLPTLQELGYKNFEVTIWHGLYAPRGTPAPVLRKLNEALKLALKDPAFVQREQALGAVVVSDRRVEPAEHRRFVASELARWTPIIKESGAVLH